MIVCNVIAIAIGKATIKQPNVGLKLPNDSFFGGFSHGAMLAPQAWVTFSAWAPSWGWPPAASSEPLHYRRSPAAQGAAFDNQSPRSEGSAPAEKVGHRPEPVAFEPITEEQGGEILRPAFLQALKHPVQPPIGTGAVQAQPGVPRQPAAQGPAPAQGPPQLKRVVIQSRIRRSRIPRYRGPRTTAGPALCCWSGHGECPHRPADWLC